jgi:hypothetical protein
MAAIINLLKTSYDDKISYLNKQLQKSRIEANLWEEKWKNDYEIMEGILDKAKDKIDYKNLPSRNQAITYITKHSNISTSTLNIESDNTILEYYILLYILTNNEGVLQSNGNNQTDGLSGMEFDPSSDRDDHSLNFDNYNDFVSTIDDNSNDSSTSSSSSYDSSSSWDCGSSSSDSSDCGGDF